MNPDTANYTMTGFGLYVPSYLAELLQHLDLTTLALYESHLRNSGKAAATIEKYTRFIQCFILSFGDHYLSIALVRAWLESMKKTKHINTVNNAVSALNGFFKWLGRADCIVSFFPYQEPQFREDRRNLEKADFDRMLDKADVRMRAILMTSMAPASARVSSNFLRWRVFMPVLLAWITKGRCGRCFSIRGRRQSSLGLCG